MAPTHGRKETSPASRLKEAACTGSPARQRSLAWQVSRALIMKLCWHTLTCICDGNMHRNVHSNFLKIFPKNIYKWGDKWSCVASTSAPQRPCSLLGHQLDRGTRARLQQPPAAPLSAFLFRSFWELHSISHMRWLQSVPLRYISIATTFCRGAEAQRLYAKPQWYSLSLGHPLSFLSSFQPSPNPAPAVLETRGPSHRTAEAAGGVQVESHVFSMQMSGANPCYGPPSSLHLCQQSHLIGDHKATPWQNKKNIKHRSWTDQTHGVFVSWVANTPLVEPEPFGFRKMTSQMLAQPPCSTEAPLQQPGSCLWWGAGSGPHADSGRKQGLRVGKETLKRKGVREQSIYFLLSSKQQPCLCSLP